MAAIAPGPEDMNALAGIIGMGNVPGNQNFWGAQGGQRLDWNQLINQLTPAPSQNQQIAGNALGFMNSGMQGIASGINGAFAQTNALNSANLANRIPLDIANTQQAGMTQRAAMFMPLLSQALGSVGGGLAGAQTNYGAGVALPNGGAKLGASGGAAPAAGGGTGYNPYAGVQGGNAINFLSQYYGGNGTSQQGFQAANQAYKMQHPGAYWWEGH